MRSLVVPAGELRHIALQVWRAHPVIGAVVPALEHRPERLHAIGVRLAANVLAQRVLHGRMVRQALVGAVLVRVDRRIQVRLAGDEPLQDRLGLVADWSGHNLVRIAVTHSQYGSLASRPSPGVPLLVPMLVAFLAADVGFVDLDRPGEGSLVVLPRLANAMRQVSRGLLRDVHVAVQLHAGYALDPGREQVRRNRRPDLIAELGIGHDRSGANREALPASAATERHGRVRRSRLDSIRAAVRALRTIRPARPHDPTRSGFVVGEHPHHVDHREPLAVALAGILAVRIPLHEKHYGTHAWRLPSARGYSRI